MSESQTGEAPEPCSADAAEPAPEAPADAQLPPAWRNALERIAVLCLADFDANNPEALVERVRQIMLQLIDGYNAKSKEREPGLAANAAATLEVARTLETAPTVYDFVRALGPRAQQPLFLNETPNEKAWRERCLNAESEMGRLRKLVADQALTIGTLKDTNARLEKRYTDHDTVELQRFRLREALVTKLTDAVRVARFHDDDGCEDCLALDQMADAVRDFKVTL